MVRQFGCCVERLALGDGQVLPVDRPVRQRLGRPDHQTNSRRNFSSRRIHDPAQALQSPTTPTEQDDIVPAAYTPRTPTNLFGGNLEEYGNLRVLGSV